MTTREEVQRLVAKIAEEKKQLTEKSQRESNLNDGDSIHMIAELFYQDIGSIYEIIEHMPRFARDTYLIMNIISEEQWDDLIEATVEAQQVNHLLWIVGWVSCKTHPITGGKRLMN